MEVASPRDLAALLKPGMPSNPALAWHPALTGPEQYGGAMEPAQKPEVAGLVQALGSARDAMGGPLTDRLAAHGAQQQARFQAGDASPTPMTAETMDLADSMAGSMMGATKAAGRGLHHSWEGALRGKADRLAAALDKMGVSYNRKGSGLSGSQYFEFYDKGDEFRKVRVSDHELPPSYGTMHGYADVEIGPHMSGSDYEAALDQIANWTGTKVPSQVKAGFAAAKSKQAAYEKRVNDMAEQLMGDRERYRALLREAAADQEIRPLLVRAKNAKSDELAERVNEAKAAFEKKYGMAEPPGAIGFSRGALKRILGE